MPTIPDIDMALRATDKTRGAFGSVNKSVGKLRHSMMNLRFAMAGIGSVLMVKDLVDSSIAMEKMTLGLRGATGSASQGAVEFAYLNEVVDKLHLDLKSSGEAFTLLTAAARGTTLEGKATRDIFEAVAASSMVLGRSTQDTEGSLYAIQQMMSKGKVTSEELRRQLGDRLPGAFKMAAKAMNMTEAELDSAMRKGEVYSNDFIPKFTKVLNEAYGSSVPGAMNSTIAKMNELNTAMFRSKAAIAQSGMIDVVKGLADAFIEVAESDTFKESVQNMADAVKANSPAIIAGIESIAASLEGLVSVAGWAANRLENFGNAARMLQLYQDGYISAMEYISANPEETKQILKSYMAMSKIERDLIKARGEFSRATGEKEAFAASQKVHALEKALAQEKKKNSESIKIGFGASDKVKGYGEGGWEVEAAKKISDSKLKIAEEEKRQKSVLESKEFQALISRLNGKEFAIQASYTKELALLKVAFAGKKEEYDKYEKILTAGRDASLAKLKKNNRDEYNNLIATQMSETEAIEDKYKKNVQIVEKYTIDGSAEREKQLKKQKQIYKDELAALKEKNNKSFYSLVESLKDEEAEIYASLMRRKDTIDKADVSPDQKASATKRVEEDFSSQVLDQSNAPELFGSKSGEGYAENLRRINEYYDKRLALVLERTKKEHIDLSKLEADLNDQRKAAIAASEEARNQVIIASSAELMGGLVGITRQMAGEQSDVYKVMFAASKAFAIADSLVNITAGIAKAANNPWPLNLAAMAAVASSTAGLISTISGATYEGAYDAGGYIPSGSVGLVGEVGPELVSGPANVMGRRKTADAMAPAAPSPQNIRIVNAFDSSVVGDYLGSSSGEKAILNVVKRNATTIKQMTG